MDAQLSMDQTRTVLYYTKQETRRSEQKKPPNFACCLKKSLKHHPSGAPVVRLSFSLIEQATRAC